MKEALSRYESSYLSVFHSGQNTTSLYVLRNYNSNKIFFTSSLDLIMLMALQHQVLAFFVGLKRQFLFAALKVKSHLLGKLGRHQLIYIVQYKSSLRNILAEKLKFLTYRRSFLFIIKYLVICLYYSKI